MSLLALALFVLLLVVGCLFPALVVGAARDFWRWGETAKALYGFALAGLMWALLALGGWVVLTSLG